MTRDGVCVRFVTEQFEKQGDENVPIDVDDHGVETDAEIAPDEIHVTVYVNDPRVRVWIANEYDEEISIRKRCQEVKVPS